jgi:predicted esterase
MIANSFNQAGLTSKHKLGGIIALSSWLPLHEKVEEMVVEANRNIQIFQGHGEADPVVQLPWGQKSRDIAQKIGANVEWHQYPGLVHSADPQEIDHLEAWLAKRLPNLD